MFYLKRLARLCAKTFILFAVSMSAMAEISIAVLDFELKDLTLAPRIPAEIERTASIKPLLEKELTRLGYQIVRIDAEAQKQADAGVGYLFDHSDAAAKLAAQFNAGYILVGRLHKPSFLFAYMMGHLIRADDGKLIGDLIAEAKGPNKKLTVKTVESLAVMIDSALNKLH